MVCLKPGIIVTAACPAAIAIRRHGSAILDIDRIKHRLVNPIPDTAAHDTRARLYNVPIVDEVGRLPDPSHGHTHT